MAAKTGMNSRRFFQTSSVRKSIGAADHGDTVAKEKLWRNLTYFVAFPAIVLGHINAYLGHIEHAKEPRPEFLPCDHLRIRRKRMPWGDGQRTLFHNPVKNALPDGYEVPDPNEGNPRHHH